MGNFAFGPLPPNIDADSGCVVFDISLAQGGGVYLCDNGTLSVVAETTTHVPPNLTSTFVSLGGPRLSGNSIAFFGEDNLGVSGVYLASAGGLTRIADTNTPIPGGNGNFVLLGGYDVDGNDVVFRGEDVDELPGIYLATNGTIEVLADTNTPIPGGTGNFA